MTGFEGGRRLVTGLVLATGSRGWQNVELIRSVLEPLPRELVVIVGAAPGADVLTRVHARKLGFHCAEIPAMWEHAPKAAGHIRNDVMLALWTLAPRYAFAFWDGTSPGTGSMIDKIHRSGYGELLQVFKSDQGAS